MLKDWQRIVFEGIPIYANAESPDWFVPNGKADKLLQELMKGKNSGHPPELRRLMNRINNNGKIAYQGREKTLNLDKLRECWIHITNRCNLSCRHCMFASSPASLHELSENEVHSLIDEAIKLGCRIFYFTGGEPFIHHALSPALKRIFKLPDTHVVMLTNLTLISDHSKDLSRFPQDRLHFQISIDGTETNHDLMRGKGAFKRLKINLKTLHKLKFPVTLAMTVTGINVKDMEAVIDFADENDVSNIHFIWLFKKGLADDSLMASIDDIFLNLIKAQKRAEQKGIKIDNIEIFRSQVFSFPKTKYDLSNAGWQSLAVGPDKYIYPTPALIYTKDMQCGHLREGLESVWKTSTVLQMIRNASLNENPVLRKNPLKFLVGGSDIDHSYINCGKITGCDPYLELYNNIVKWLIVEESRKYTTNSLPAFQLKMGEKLGQCPLEGTGVFFTHSNCVLSLPGHDTHTLVNAFYTEAAESPKEDILNPVCYSEELISHIPEESRFRGYGCGSPVEDAKLKTGERVVDLGSGTGIECFIASRIVGREGKVIGIDMGDAMLRIANQTKTKVEKNLGYSNVKFIKAFLEELPLNNESTDVIISNCVINLSPDKRKVFSEIMRVLKLGGRLIISDITYDDDIPLKIKYNEKLRGECLGGALHYHDLFGLLDDLGFANSRIISSYLYRTVKGYDFYSITYEAFKSGGEKKFVMLERQPFKEILKSALTTPVCTCFIKPEQIHIKKEKKPETVHLSGCMVCGETLEYLKKDTLLECFFCGSQKKANAICKKGHFVCDVCHSADSIKIIKQVCLNTKEDDMISLMKKIRSYPSFPIHGPEHHSLVPAVILAAYRNSGGKLSNDQLIAGIDRGSTIPGGSCAFMGACGAAIGAGIAFSIIIEANPYQATNRQLVQRVTQKVLGEIANFEAARCCQRDSWIALKMATRLSEKNLGIRLKADMDLICSQFNKNKECIKAQCPLWPGKNKVR
jgi:MoaA/NifB/PqqE/SkfB family radical SAM enzyme/ubiquinone/menaquinone biosynthesis C-methylase UbiE